MKKLFLKISVIAIFMVVLFVNVSISAIKKGGNSHLSSFMTEANAACESGLTSGKCLVGSGHCTADPLSHDCGFGGW